MEQHPVPQQISSYQFRLVGDMTLKQFFQLAGGALIALLFYASPLPAIFKWPLVAIFALSGAALAFLPFEERPLEIWILAFFRSIYSPTMFYWKKDRVQSKYFADETPASAAALPTAAPAGTPPATTVSSANTYLARLEEGEKSFMSSVTTLMQNAPTQTVTPPAAAAVPAPVVATPISIQTPAPVKKVEQVYEAPKVVENTGPIPSPALQPVAQTLATEKAGPSSTAQFSPDAAPPLPPTQANIIVGQVMDADGRIVEGAILEVKDMQSRPVRALKTNRAGHFLIVTPLANGIYQLTVEKGDMNFDPLTFEAKGEIIPAIAIRAKQNPK